MKKIFLFIIFFFFSYSFSFALENGTYKHSSGAKIVISGDSVELYGTGGSLVSTQNINPGDMSSVTALIVSSIDYTASDIMYSRTDSKVLIYRSGAWVDWWAPINGADFLRRTTQYGSTERIAFYRSSDGKYVGQSGNSFFISGHIRSGLFEEPLNGQLVLNNEVLTISPPLTCTEKPYNFQSPTNFIPTWLPDYNEPTYQTGAYNVAITSFTGGSVSFLGTENIENINLGLSDATESVSFNSQNRIIGPNPVIIVNSEKMDLDNFKLFTSQKIDSFFSPSDILVKISTLDLNGNVIKTYDYITNSEIITFPPAKTLQIDFKKQAFSKYYIDTLIVGKSIIIPGIRLECQDSLTGEWFLDGEPIDGPSDNYDDLLTDIDSHFLENYSCSGLDFISPRCVLKSVKELLSTLPGYNLISDRYSKYFSFFDFTLTPGVYEFSLKLPTGQNLVQQNYDFNIPTSFTPSSVIFPESYNSENKTINYFVLLVALVFYYVGILAFLVVFVFGIGFLILRFISFLIQLLSLNSLGNGSEFSSRSNILGLIFLSSFFITFIAIFDFIFNPVVKSLSDTFTTFKEVYGHFISFGVSILTKSQVSFIPTVNTLNELITVSLLALGLYIIVVRYGRIS